MVRYGYILYIAVMGCWLVGLLRRVVLVWLARRRRGYVQACYRRVVRQLMVLLLEERVPEEIALPIGRLPRWREALVGMLCRIGTAVYALPMTTWRGVVCRYGLERWLLGRIRRTRGVRRSGYLKQLADLPMSRTIAAEVVRYRADKCPQVRFCALLVGLVAEPAELLRLVATYEARLTMSEAAEVLHLLRRRLVPIAYRPLLESSCANLQCVGLAIVAQFGIEEAEDALLTMVAGEDAELARRALWVLVVLRAPLRHRAVRQCVRCFSPQERQRWMRYLAGEGYAMEQVRWLFGEEVYYGALIGSYKRSLVCG